MALKNKYLLIILMLYPLILWSETKQLKEYQTKQAIEKIRFISEDGKITYYQQRSGSLFLSKNYKAFEILNSDEYTDYQVITSSTQKKALILSSSSYHFNQSTFAYRNIYISNIGEKETTLIGKGISARLHLQDTWVSYFIPKSNKIHFYSVESKLFNFMIQLNNPQNPYFIPEVILLSENEILYTDIGKDGQYAIVKYTKSSKSVEIVYKAPEPNVKIEMCTYKKALIVAEFGLYDSKYQSQFYSLNLNDKLNFDKKKLLYKSDNKDIGNMLCHEKSSKIYFVKNVQTLKKLPYSEQEIASLDPSTNKLDILTDLKFATQIVLLDNRLLVPFRGKYYLLFGKNNATEDKL